MAPGAGYRTSARGLEPPCARCSGDWSAWASPRDPVDRTLWPVDDLAVNRFPARPPAGGGRWAVERFWHCASRPDRRQRGSRRPQRARLGIQHRPNPRRQKGCSHNQRRPWVQSYWHWHSRCCGLGGAGPQLLHEAPTGPLHTGCAAAEQDRHEPSNGICASNGAHPPHAAASDGAHPPHAAASDGRQPPTTAACDGR